AAMAIPSVPYKRWNAIFLLVIYPLLTFILLTGGNLNFSLSTILGFIGLLLLSALAVPVFAFGVEDGISRNRVALVLAVAALAIFLVSLFISMPALDVFGNYVSIAILLSVVLLAAAAVLSIAHEVSSRDVSARSALLGWIGACCAILAILVLVTADF